MEWHDAHSAAYDRDEARAQDPDYMPDPYADFYAAGCRDDDAHETTRLLARRRAAFDCLLDGFLESDAGIRAADAQGFDNPSIERLTLLDW